MKQLIVPRTRLRGQRDMAAALHAVFGREMLRRMHGPDTKAGDFVDGKRSFKFTVSVDSVPPPIRRFFCGNELRVTTRQIVDQTDPVKWTVTNRLKLHFVGSEFFKLRPTFWLERDPDDGCVYLGGTVRHDAVLPPPLDGIAENFMMLNTRKEIMHFATCLRDAGLLSPVALNMSEGAALKSHPIES